MDVFCGDVSEVVMISDDSGWLDSGRVGCRVVLGRFSSALTSLFVTFWLNDGRFETALVTRGGVAVPFSVAMRSMTSVTVPEGGNVAMTGAALLLSDNVKSPFSLEGDVVGVDVVLLVTSALLFSTLLPADVLLVVF